MTAPTPQQMRALADKNDAEAEAWRGFSKTSGRIALHEESAAALRTAADKLEAVRAWLAAVEDDDAHWSALDAILDGASDD